MFPGCSGIFEINDGTDVRSVPFLPGGEKSVSGYPS